MWDTIASALYLFLPAYGANMAPVFATRFNVFPAFAFRLDGGRTFRDKPIFGRNKTVRGAVFGVGVGIGVAMLQYGLQSNPAVAPIVLFMFAHMGQAVLWGALLGVGAIVGDAAKSFVKRQLNIAPGRMWFPWDQLDMVFGALVLGSFMYSFVHDISTVFVVVFLTPLLGIAVNVLGYYLSVKERV